MEYKTIWRAYKDMIRIFVTGDNHIGLKYAGHEHGEDLAKSRLDAFYGMVEKANQENCSLFVIAGDLFENTGGVSKKDIKTLLERLSSFHGTVAVLPGNHDYYDREVTVWQCFREVMKAYDNIMLLSDYRPYAITADGENAVLYPAFCTSRHSEPNQNNLDWIKKENIVNDDTYRIGIAHGAVAGETMDREGQYFLMTRAELESIPVDVWLIGHTHVPFPRDLTERFAPCERILNPGAHVQTDVSCDTEGLCFIVEIENDKKIRAKKFVSGNLRFYRKNIYLTAGEMENILTRELGGIDKNSVVDIILTGAVTPGEYEERHHILEKALSGFLEGTYDDYALSKQITKELIEAEFPETSFSAGLLNALLDEPKEAQLTYELLKSLREDK